MYRVHGSLESPEVEGAARTGKATILCPYLKFPITNLGGLLRLSDNMLTVGPSSSPGYDLMGV